MVRGYDFSESHSRSFLKRCCESGAKGVPVFTAIQLKKQERRKDYYF
jgi:hypothetical protein